MKDFAGKQSGRNKKQKSSPKFRTTKKNISPLSLRAGILIFGAIALFLILIFQLMNTDIKPVIAKETKTTIEFTFPSDLEKNWVLAEIDEQLTTQSCEYLLQVETYGKNIYAQELIGKMLELKLNAYVEKAFSPSAPGKTFYRVLSGPYVNKSSVNNAREKLIKNGSRPLILTRCTST
ncbi:MAG: SPOR domain-containing protein [Gammaproteobacteria bacterium]|jgi:cell division protein FtsN